VAQLATHIAVMRSGQFVECGPSERILREPASAYACEPLAAVPEIPRSAQM
jgi:ABC-type dipeptide/oligopeptide/nickel transport system ATPase component